MLETESGTIVTVEVYINAGYGYDIPTTYRTGWAVFIGTGALTVLTWIVVAIAWAS